MLRKFLYLLLVIGSLELSGCASNAGIDQMAYDGATTKTMKMASLKNNISVSNVNGGSETNPLLASQINNENFKSALEKSLQHADLYHNLNGEKYQLNASLVKLDRPFIGLDLTVNCKVHYTLRDLKLKKTIYDKDISSSYTATFSDAALAITRLKMANEGAAKANIKKLIEDLYHL